LGQGIGGALGGQDPQLQLISRREALASQLDPNNPDSYMQVAKMAADAGDPQFAILIADAGRKAQSEMARAAQLGAEKMTNEQRNAMAYANQFGNPDSIEYKEAYQQRFDELTLKSGKANKPFEFEAKEARLQELKSGLRVLQNQETPNNEAIQRLKDSIQSIEGVEKTKDDVVVVGNALVSKTTGKPIYQGDKPEKYSAFAQELIDAGLKPDTEPFQRRMLDYINEKTKGAGKGTGNVTIGGISIDTGVAAKAAGKVIGENVANIESQFSLQTGVSDALKLIDKGIYAGAYGPEKGFVAKYSLGTIGDPKKVQNTEVFLANIGEIVIPRLQQFGGNDSNEELKYLQKVVAGDQRLEPESMRRILASAEKKIANNIRRLQKQAESGSTGANLPLEPMQPTPSQPKATKRYNPQTKKLEVITGE
jgi:hypothetical protein